MHSKNIKLAAKASSNNNHKQNGAQPFPHLQMKFDKGKALTKAITLKENTHSNLIEELIDELYYDSLQNAISLVQLEEMEIDDDDDLFQDKTVHQSDFSRQHTKKYNIQ